jgi:tetratricopeptide (TPR) repeat protein
MQEVTPEKPLVQKPRRRVARVLVALALLFAGLAVASFCFKNPIKAQLKELFRSDASRVEEAARAYDQGEWERAADLSRPLLKTRGNDPEVLRTYARASARLERDRTAAAIFQDRLGTERMQPEDSFLLGLVLARANKFESAREVWEAAAGRGPDHAEMLQSLGRLLIGFGRLDEAAEHARRLSRQTGWEARGSLLLGEVQSKLEDPLGAVEAIDRGLKLDPTAKGAHYPLGYYRKLLARSMLKIGRPAEALVPLKAELDASGLPGADAEVSWLSSRAYLQLGRIAEANEAAKLAGSYSPRIPNSPEPAPYVGSARCAGCHPELSRAYQASRHARTFHHGAGLLKLPFPELPLADPDDPKVTHAFAHEKDRIVVTTKAGKEIYKTVVEYAFGLLERYATMVGRDDQKTYRALRLSSYHTPEGVAWGRTSGDVPDSNSAENVRGEPISVRDGVVRCLYCHVTDFRAFRDPPPERGPSLAAADSAIGCERCHGPGANHVAAAKAGFFDQAIVNPGTVSADAVNRLCADCHIVGPPEEIKKSPEAPNWVRSVGFTMTLSRCYTESSGGLSCLTCHDPHRDDRGPASFFEAKCLTCHSGPAGRPPERRVSEGVTKGVATQEAMPGKVCPVNPVKDCLGCHMPKIPVEALHTSLTDHYIRVRNAKDAEKKPAQVN